jgi:hypothetical protein
MERRYITNALNEPLIRRGYERMDSWSINVWLAPVVERLLAEALEDAAQQVEGISHEDWCPAKLHCECCNIECECLLAEAAAKIRQCKPSGTMPR